MLWLGRKSRSGTCEVDLANRASRLQLTQAQVAMVYTGFEWIQLAQNKGQRSRQRRTGTGSQRIRSLATVKGGSIQRPHRQQKKKGTSLIPHGKRQGRRKRRAIGGTIPQTSDFFTNSFMRLHLPHFFQKENNSNFGIGKARVFGFLGNRPAGVL